MSDFQDLIIRQLEERIDAGAMSAAAVRVEKNGELLLDWAGGYQEFDLDSQPVDTESIFHVASISKPMVTSGCGEDQYDQSCVANRRTRN